MSRQRLVSDKRIIKAQDLNIQSGPQEPATLREGGNKYLGWPAPSSERSPIFLFALFRTGLAGLARPYYSSTRTMRRLSRHSMVDQRGLASVSDAIARPLSSELHVWQEHTTS